MKAKEFSKALLYHLKWKVQIRKFVEGSGHMTGLEFSSPESCSFKKWLSSREIIRYASRYEIQQLEALHTDMHEIAKRIYELKSSGHDSVARREFKNLEKATLKLLSLLNTKGTIDNSLGYEQPERKSGR